MQNMTGPRGVAPSNSASRMTLANVTRGRQERPIRVCLAGIEGVGKSTFAANAPAPIFLCSEDGTAQLDVARFPTPRSWADVLEAVRVLTSEEHAFRSLAIDTLDWLEPLCWEAVCQANGKKAIEDLAYGRGYALALDQWRHLIGRLELLQRTRKMHVVLLAHTAIKRINNPDTDAFDRFQMKLHDKAAALWREWVDELLFARHEVVTIEKRGKLRGVSSGARVMHTQWTAAYDAKNRHDLPETMPLDWQDFEEAIKAHVPANPEKLKAELLELIPRLPDPDKARKALETWAGDSAPRLAQLLDKVRSKVSLHEAGMGEEPTAGEEGGAS
jgi:hypothetical protein